MDRNYGIWLLLQRYNEITATIEKLEKRFSADLLYENPDYELLQEKRGELQQVIFRFCSSESQSKSEVFKATYRMNGQVITFRGTIAAETPHSIVLRSEEFKERLIPRSSLIRFTNE